MGHFERQRRDYNGIPAMQVVVETSGYLKREKLLFTANERAEVVIMVAKNPLIGDLIALSGAGNGDGGFL